MIGAPVQLGSTTAAAGSATLVLTTTADAPAGSLIVVFAGIGGNTAISGVTDSAGNAYAIGTSVSATGGRQRVFHSPNALHLVSGGTLTVTYGATTSTKLMAAVAVAGCANADVEGAGSTGTGTAISVSTGALGQAAEIVFGMCLVLAGASDGFTEATGFTGNTAALNGAALRWAYQIVSSTGSVTYTPTLGTSRTWAANTKTFKGAVASPFNRAAQFTYLEM